MVDFEKERRLAWELSKQSAGAGKAFGFANGGRGEDSLAASSSARTGQALLE